MHLIRHWTLMMMMVSNAGSGGVVVLNRRRSTAMPPPLPPPPAALSTDFINLFLVVPSPAALLRRILTFSLLFAAVALPCFLLYRAAYQYHSSMFLTHSSRDLHRYPPIFQHLFDSSSFADDDESLLERILRKAAMADGTVILTTLNGAWAAPGSIIDLFIESFHIGDRTRKLLSHLVIIALDHKAYIRCLGVHSYCYALNTDGVDFSQEAYFMTSAYLKMMWRRIDFLLSVLQMGYNFVFTDADIMWLRDPFPHFYLDADFQIACDHFIGSSYNVENRPNGGFNYVKSNNRTIAFYKFWYSSREVYPGYHDQDVLNRIKHDPFIVEIGLKMRFLNTVYFGGFCEPSKYFSLVCTMHANCCYGLESKLHDLKIMLEDWRTYMSSPMSAKRIQLSYWRVPQNCSLESLHRYNGSMDNPQLGQVT